MCFAILMGFFQVRQLRWRPITIFTNNHCIVFVLIVISSNPSPLPSKVCPCGGRARSSAHHLGLRDLLVRELHHHCRLSQVRREIVGIFFCHPALSFFFSNNALEPSSLVICNGIVELVQVDNQTKTVFPDFPKRRSRDHRSTCNFCSLPT